MDEAIDALLNQTLPDVLHRDRMFFRALFVVERLANDENQLKVQPLEPITLAASQSAQLYIPDLSNRQGVRLDIDGNPIEKQRLGEDYSKKVDMEKSEYGKLLEASREIMQMRASRDVNYTAEELREQAEKLVNQLIVITTENSAKLVDASDLANFEKMLREPDDLLNGKDENIVAKLTVDDE